MSVLHLFPSVIPGSRWWWSVFVPFLWDVPGYSAILPLFSSGVLPTSFFNPTAALHSSSFGNRGSERNIFR